MTASLFDVPPALSAALLERWDVPVDHTPDLALLNSLYLAWCRNVPFDNVRKRIFQTEGGRGDVPGATAEIFLQDHVETGTGGTCWSTSMGLVALARSLGFEARLVSGVMHTDPELRPNHASVVVTCPDGRYLLDTSMLFERPLHLRSQRTAHPGPLHPVSAEPSAIPGNWVVRWLPGHSRAEAIGCDVSLDPVSEADIWAWHDRTRVASLFNDHLFLRRNTSDGIVSYGRGTLIRVDGTGQLSRTDVPDIDRDRLLAGLFGIDAGLLGKVPFRGAGPAFL